MRKFILVLLLTFSLIKGIVNAQNDSIAFMENVYDEAIELADQSYKPILFYFYSDYCYECIPLDSILRMERLTDYFNLNYVNVKVDYNEPMGIRLRKKFNVNSLPALAFINQDNILVSLLEDEITVEKILNHARWTTNPASRSQDFLHALEMKEKILNWEKIDSVFDFTVVNNMVVENENATTLYYQTKMHKILNDGLADEHAEKYLKTQEDWSTDKNLQFIYNNLNDTRSEAFEFLLKNRGIFSKKFGSENIDSLVESLIYKRLYQLQPPPDYDEAKFLMTLRSPENSDMRTYEYLIDLKLKTIKIVQYLFLERKYIKKFAPKDHERMIRMIKIYLDKIKENYNTNYYIEVGEIANKLSPNNIDYLVTLSRLYIKQGDKCGALETSVRAYSLAMEEMKNPAEIMDMILEIDKMHDDH